MKIADARHMLPLLLAAMLVLTATPVAARAHHGYGEAQASVALAELPAEARTTLQLIRQGGPFPFPRDGVVFGNFEKRLPRQARGYYHEYTVRTPSVRSRGARRIICGPPTECYYSDDHYETFKRIRE